MAEKDNSTCSDEEGDQDNEKTKKSKDKNYSLSKEHNGKLIKLYFDEDADTTKKKKIKANLLKQYRGTVIADMKLIYNTITQEMDFELCNLIMMLDSKKQFEKLQQIIVNFHTSNNFEVKNPKSVNGGTRINIDKHIISESENKDIKTRYLIIYFHTKENKVMVQGPCLNLQTFVDKYLYDFSNPLTANDHIVSTTGSVTSQEKKSEHSIPENSTSNNEDVDNHDDLSEFTDGTDLSDVSILTKSDLKLLEEQFEQKLSKLQGTIEAQNANYKDLEVQFQNKMKQQIQKFTDK